MEVRSTMAPVSITPNYFQRNKKNTKAQKSSCSLRSLNLVLARALSDSVTNVAK